MPAEVRHISGSRTTEEHPTTRPGNIQPPTGQVDADLSEWLAEQPIDWGAETQGPLTRTTQETT